MMFSEDRRYWYDRFGVEIPVVKAIKYIRKKDPSVFGTDSVVVLCPFCGEEHIHGADNGMRSSHCRNRQSGTYYVEIDQWIDGLATQREGA